MMSLSIIEERLSENLETKSPFLDLGGCDIYDLPDELQKFSWLEAINLGDGKLDRKGVFQPERSSAKQANTLGRADWGILQPLKLKRLYLIGCKIHDLEGLSGLVTLESVDLSDNELSDLTALARLNHLKQLWLNRNEISDLSPLDMLSRLTLLELSSNKIEELSPLSGLTGLSSLRLNKNHIRLLDSLEKLLQLRTLAAASNLVQNLAPLSNLKRLNHLNLAENQIKDMGGLTQLPELKELLLADNRIERIRPLTALHKLRHVDLSRNPIQDCDPEIWQTGDINDIRSWFLAKDREQKSAGAAMKSKAKLAHGTIPLQDVKLILVGNSDTGKTQLSRYLETGTYKDVRQSTHGMRLKRWLPQPPRFDDLTGRIAVNIWDFGGQEYYHGAYRLFLSNSAVYILLWEDKSNANMVQETAVDDERKVQLRHFHYRYWLDNIRYFAPDSRILVVQNKIDRDGKKRIEPEAFHDYDIWEDHYISLQKAAMDEMRYRPGWELFLNNLDDCLQFEIRTSKPASWRRIREALWEMTTSKRTKGNPFRLHRKGKKWISLQSFKKACAKLDPDLTEVELNHGLPRWLHNAGAVIYFSNHPILQDRIFFDPRWVTDGIYAILDDTIRLNEGRFNRAQVEARQDKDLAETFLALMQEMEIIFEIQGQPDHFIAPQYLPEHHPVEDLFAIAANGLQKSAFSVRLPLFYFQKALRQLLYYYGCADHVRAKYYWKYGVLFEKGGVRILIKGIMPEHDQNDGVLMLGAEQVEGHQNVQKAVFDRLLDILDDRSLPAASTENGDDSAVDRRDPGWTSRYRHEAPPRWLRTIELSSDGASFVSYLDLCHAGEDGEISVRNKDGVQFRLLDFESLLDRTVPKAVRIFLSYSHTDTSLLNRLRMHLSPLRRAKRIEVWTDQELVPGDQWDDMIHQNLEQADVIVLVLTADFIASDYVWEVELKAALERAANHQVKLIPILMQPLDYNAVRLDQSLKALIEKEMLPKNDQQRLQPVTLWENPEAAFASIATSIREAIEQS